MELLLSFGMLVAASIVVGWIVEDTVWFLQSAGVGCLEISLLFVAAAMAWMLSRIL